MDKWNPLLVAIALKKIDIVKYFLEDLKIAIKYHGKEPEPANEAFSVSEKAN